jgi:hypothetical protein
VSSLRNALILVLALVAIGLGVRIASAALSQVTVAFTVDEANPASFTNPVDDDCPVGWPCKVKSDLNVADNNQLAASVTSISPTAFTGAIGTLIPNGTVVGNTHVSVWWDAFSSNCSSLSILKVKVEDTKDFLDGGIKGEVSDDSSQEALGSPILWPTRLETDLRVSYLLSTGHPVARRSVTVLDGPLGIEHIPVNLLSFDVSDGDGFAGLTLQGTYNVAVVGDPTSPPSGSMCTPMASNSLLLGQAASRTLLRCQVPGTHTMTTVLTRESGGSLVIDANVSDTVSCSTPVGGIAEFDSPAPDAAAGGSGSSAPGAPLLAGLAVGGCLLLAGGAWYARRRWVR